MLHRRLIQFFFIYFLGLAGLFALKCFFGLSDYVIPGAYEVRTNFISNFVRYTGACANTLAVAVVGHFFSILLAFAVGILSRKNNRIGTFVKSTAYSIQSYPIVVLAPIIFILVGDGILARLLMASMICYFPLLLSFIGIFTEPVTEIEHFFTSTGKMRWFLEIKIRAFENMEKLFTVVSGSATLAMVGTIIAEFIAADAGIGYNVRKSLYQNNLANILTALFIIGVATSLYLTVLEWCGLRIRGRWLAPKET